jgi:uncharacterized protein (DUF4415 family)
MGASDFKKPSKPDWEGLDDIVEEMDTSDLPPSDKTFFSNSRLRLAEKSVPVTVEIEADLLEWYKAQGGDFQSRINAALRIYAEAHRERRQ